MKTSESESLSDHIDDENNQYILRERLDNKTLALAIEEEIYKYAKSNLAIINIFIKVQTIKTISGDFEHVNNFLIRRSRTASGSGKLKR